MAKKIHIKPLSDVGVSIIGIVSTLPNYRIIHHINLNTFLKLTCKADFPVYFEKLDDVIDFNFYYYASEEFYSDFCFISNNSNGLRLFPSHKNFTAFLLIQGGLPEENIKFLAGKVNTIVGVQLASLIKESDIKGIDPILEDLELHLVEMKKEKRKNASKIMPSPEEQ